jgi:hypothetical protein
MSVILCVFQICYEDESDTDVSIRINSRQQKADPKPKVCTVTSSEGNGSNSVSCSEGPIAVHLQRNKDQSKKMAAMTNVDSLPVKDMASDEKKRGLSVAEEDKSKEIHDVRTLSAQIGLHEQQLEYKLRKEREYQNQLRRQARQLAVKSCPIQGHDMVHSGSPENAEISSCGKYTISSESTEHGKSLDQYDSSDTMHPDDGLGAGGTSTSRSVGHMYTGDQIKVARAETVRFGPGYSVLVLPKPSRSCAATSESSSTWVEVSSSMSICACQNSSVSLWLQAG